jgi:protein-disulfide isomerase
VDFGGHPATRDLAGQPYFGPHPGEAVGTVVAFEDPSCSRCAAFEQETVERIRTELAASGDATFVFRGYPIVYPWGEPASKVLEATLDRSPRAHFAMAREYYGNQGDYSTDNVYDRSRSRLAELTDVDADAVVADARDRAFDDAVETDLAAGEAANATTTPAVYMFRGREFRTRASGSLGFEAVRTALGL